MAKLSTIKISWIDDHLYNMGVKYMDIRYEMVDHIASELEQQEGDFNENLEEYFIMHSNEILKQNKRARRTATLKAIKLYFKTMVMPSVVLAAIIMGALSYFASFLVENEDLYISGLYALLVMLIPLFWVSRGNRDISVLRPMVLINSFLYLLYQGSNIFYYRIDDKALRIIPTRIAITVVPALMLVLIISLYRCRKQYVGKYI